MKYLVDAMVLSEPAKPTPDPRVIAWLRALEPDIAVDPVILGEPETLFDAGAGRLHRLPWDADTGSKRAELLARLRATGASKRRTSGADAAFRNSASTELTNRRFDDADPLRQASSLHRDQFEAEVPVRLFVSFLETQRVLKADAPRFGWRHKAQIANEENSILVNCFFLDALQLPGKDG